MEWNASIAFIHFLISSMKSLIKSNRTIPYLLGQKKTQRARKRHMFLLSRRHCRMQAYFSDCCYFEKQIVRTLSSLNIKKIYFPCSFSIAINKQKQNQNNYSSHTSTYRHLDVEEKYWTYIDTVKMELNRLRNATFNFHCHCHLCISIVQIWYAFDKSTTGIIFVCVRIRTCTLSKPISRLRLVNICCWLRDDFGFSWDRSS